MSSIDIDDAAPNDATTLRTVVAYLAVSGTSSCTCSPIAGVKLSRAGRPGWLGGGHPTSSYRSALVHALRKPGSPVPVNVVRFRRAGHGCNHRDITVSPGGGAHRSSVAHTKFSRPGDTIPS